MVPDSVLNDDRIGASAIRVYANLARRRKALTPKATVGLRFLAELAKLSKQTVVDALAELEAAGHIKVTGTGKGRRTYRLTSGRFRRSIMAEAAGEVIEYYDDDDGVAHKRMVVSRPRSATA